MNREEQKRLMIGNSLFWGAAIATPVVVQVVLDLFDRETAGSVAIVSMFVLFLLSGIDNRWLATKLPKAGGEST
jgi:hypothetical protein